jgi:hypothetical protein
MKLFLIKYFFLPMHRIFRDFSLFSSSSSSEEEEEEEEEEEQTNKQTNKHHKVSQSVRALFCPSTHII